MSDSSANAKEAEQAAVWQLAFRAGFLGAAGFAVVSIVLWLAWLEGLTDWRASYQSGWWHAHEMLFGFAMPVVAGFLLTAVATWTGIAATRGARLQLLFGSWLLARCSLIVAGDLALEIAAVADTVFILLCCWEMAKRVWPVRQTRNYVFVPILLMFCALNLYSYRAALSGESATEIHFGVIWLMLTLIAIVGGRVIPFFTARKLQHPQTPILSWLDHSAIVGLLLVVALASSGELYARAAFSQPLLVGVGLLHGARLYSWWSPGVFSVPLLWSLYLSYAFIPLGLLTLAYTGVEPASGRQVMHILAIGGVAGMILAMTARVSLGHTGRELEAGNAMSVAFLLLALAALVRGLLPMVLPAFTAQWWRISAVLWIVAFSCFLLRYSAVLLKKRPDGKPG
jgi:uncharacterized protein involved in response to NO